MLDYAYEIEYFDSQLVKMLEILEKRGELENTIVIVTADNGMPFPRAKGQVYELSNHVPLAIMWGKGIKNPGRKIFDFISFIDFAPTLLEAAGIERVRDRDAKNRRQELCRYIQQRQERIPEQRAQSCDYRQGTQ